MGCYHTLQPDKNPFAPPSIPALTPQGFVRWQTVQLLLGPEEHVPFLQTAVKRLGLSNPIDGKPFPTWLPRNALPSRPDPETLQWHQKVSDRLKIEAQRPQVRGIPGTHPGALSDGTSDGTLESSDDQSLVDAANYFSEQRPRPPFRHPEPLHMPPYASGPTSRRGTSKDPRPWTPERRRSNSDPHLHRPEFRDDKSRRNDPRSHHRRRSSSTISTSSTSSYTSSSSSGRSDDLGRRHRTSSSATLQPPRSRQASQQHDPQRPQSVRHSPLSHSSTFPYRPTSRQDPAPHRNPSAPGRGNMRGHNVRWGADSVHNISSSQDRYRERDGKSRARSEGREGRRNPYY